MRRCSPARTVGLLRRDVFALKICAHNACAALRAFLGGVYEVNHTAHDTYIRTYMYMWHMAWTREERKEKRRERREELATKAVGLAEPAILDRFRKTLLDHCFLRWAYVRKGQRRIRTHGLARRFHARGPAAILWPRQALAPILKAATIMAEIEIPFEPTCGRLVGD